jgi:DNA-binding response OmpR family regulator
MLVRLLIIEDDKHLAGAKKSGLEGSGYAVDMAPNGQFTLEMACFNLPLS